MFEKALRSCGGIGNGNRKLLFLITICPKLLNFSVNFIKNSNDN